MANNTTTTATDNNNKMTEKEMLTFIMEHLDMYSEVQDWCQRKIAAIDSANQKKKERTALSRALKLQKDCDMIQQIVAENGGYMFCSQIAEEAEVSVQKASSILKELVSREIVERVAGKGSAKPTFRIIRPLD